MVDSAKDKGAGESSGLADIIEIAEAIGSTNDAGYGVTPTAPADDDDQDLGAGYGSQAAAAVVAAEPPKESAPAAKKRDRAAATRSGESGRVVATPAPATTTAPKRSSAIVWVAVVGIAAVGGGWWFMQQQNAAKSRAKAEAAALASAQEPVEESEPVEPEPTPEEAKEEVAVAAPPPVEPEPAAVEAEAAEETPEEVVAIVDEPTATKSKPATKSESKPSKASGDDPVEPAPKVEPKAAEPKPAEPKPAEPKPAEPKPDDSSKFSSDCVLDPSKPGCGGAKTNPDKPTTDVDASLPDKLTNNQIRDGFAALKAKAKSCGSEHGVAAGTTVRVKVSISGSTGKVLSASALSPHDSEPVGKCVADILKDATFPRFASTQQGTTYPVPM